jgi:hypothetical protein
MIINISYDSSVASAPTAFKAAINYVVNYFDTLFINPVTININVGWGEVNGQPLSGALGQSFANLAPTTYTQITNALVGNSAAASLPTNDPTNGGPFWIPTADAKALGLPSANSAGIDGSVGFDSAPGIFTFDPNNRAVPGQYDFIGVAFHEISEVMGRIVGLGSFGYSTMDLFRYSAPGTPQLQGGQPAYFSIDGGKTNLDNFNTSSGGDYGDWANSAGNDAFRAFSSSGVLNAVTSADVALLDAIGWNTVSSQALPAISASQIQAEDFAVTRATLPLDQATSIASSINSGAQTEVQFINDLLSQVADTTIPAVAVEGSMCGAVGTSPEVTLLATQFLPAQVAFATQHGFNPLVFSSEALGVVFAFNNENGSTAFATTLGPTHAGMPNSAAGDAAFAAAASSSIFGSASTPTLINAIENYVSNWKTFFTNNGLHGSADQIDLAARGTAWGDAVGLALSNNLGPLNAQTINFLEDAAQGTAIYSASLSSQPNHAAFQGAATASVASAANDVQLTGVAAHIDHIVM